MAVFSRKDKATLEKYLQMGGGYVLDFSNRTFAEFFIDFGIDIEDEQYSTGYSSGSKANRLRGFWDLSDDQLVGKVLLGLIEHYDALREQSVYHNESHSDEMRAECLKIANELIHGLYNSAILPGARLVKPTPQKAKKPSLDELQGLFSQSNNTTAHSSPNLSAQTTNVDNPLHSMKKQRVFVVHGHDDTLRLEVELFIRKVGLEPIILMDQASSGDTIIEKIERCGDADFAVVLYTPCDLGKHKDALELKGRARQNVVFEHGYFIARLGRRKLSAIVKQGVEIQNDIQGVVYISADNWQSQLLKEFRGANLTFDANSLYA